MTSPVFTQQGQPQPWRGQARSSDPERSTGFCAWPASSLALVLSLWCCSPSVPRPCDAFGLIVRGIVQLARQFGLRADGLGAAAPVRGRAAGHLRGRHVEHRHRGADGAGRHLRHGRHERPAGSCRRRRGAVAGRPGGQRAARCGRSLAGVLKLYGKVNEIFGGLGLNFIASSLTVYLVLGPWKRPGIGSTSGTEPFPPALWLPRLPGFPVSPVEILLGLAAIVCVDLALRGTGLRPAAEGHRQEPALGLPAGVPTEPHLLLAFAPAAPWPGWPAGCWSAAPSCTPQPVPADLQRLRLPGHPGGAAGGSDALWSMPISFFFAADRWAACNWRCSGSWTPRWAG